MKLNSYLTKITSASTSNEYQTRLVQQFIFFAFLNLETCWSLSIDVGGGVTGAIVDLILLGSSDSCSHLPLILFLPMVNSFVTSVIKPVMYVYSLGFFIGLVLQLPAAFECTLSPERLFYNWHDVWKNEMTIAKSKPRIKIYRQYICHNINLLIQCILQ